ncbi:hypothetical protein AB0L04_00805 [Streptomyces glaucescens]|uniref:hypothetical protein n=1 Tax=Streptomyces glaucescens TaxID=1907 RepID=UPI00344BB365
MTAKAAAPDQGEAPATKLGALSRLVHEVNVSGVTFQEMADRGVDPDGKKLPKQWYQKLITTPPVKAPSYEQIHTIATATGKPIRHIQEAVARQWLLYEATELAGYGEDVRIIIAHLAGKSPDDLRRWRYMIEAEERARREAGE